MASRSPRLDELHPGPTNRTNQRAGNAAVVGGRERVSGPNPHFRKKFVYQLPHFGKGFWPN